MTGLVISGEPLAHLRVALLGDVGIALEDLWTHSSVLEAEIERAEQPGLAANQNAYHELMRAVQARYDLQQSLGLPGEPLARFELDDPAQQALATRALSDYRDAAIHLLEGGHMSIGRTMEAERRIEIIDGFLGERAPGEGQRVA